MLKKEIIKAYNESDSKEDFIRLARERTGITRIGLKPWIDTLIFDKK